MAGQLDKCACSLEILKFSARIYLPPEGAQKITEYDQWAEVYDIMYGNYRDDIDFYVRESKKVQGKVLEVGCGTGRIYIELLKEGIDVEGIDISGRMLAQLREKAAALNLQPEVSVADMRNFDLGREFSLIIVPFRSFLYNITPEEQMSSLRSFYRHLKPGGKLILNFFYPDLEMLMGMNKESEELLVSDGGKYVLRQRSYFVNEVDQTIETIAVLYKDGELYWKGTQRLALIFKREFELLLRITGFKGWAVYGGFDCRPLTSYKQEMVWIAEK
ncbi:MAG: class I SAM-dependent methyltransferase [Candidatus Verstraetearchaeota archaeon]|nr:class I SAM-dependent methyltransferase [Candidatus Verstraetearchaeota archaeon]